MSCQSFSFTTCKKLICEINACENLAQECQGLERVLFITDAGVAGLNLHQSALCSLEKAGIQTFVFDEVEADPSESVVLNAVAMAKKIDAQCIIGFGGGSSMDVAKLVSFLAQPENTQSLNDLYGIESAKGSRLPLIQIPTTAGTGSEVTAVAIVTIDSEEQHASKMGAVSTLFLPDVAILDAQLTLNLPAHITAATGIDAMVHAIEAFTSKIKKNPLSDMLAKQALHLLAGNIYQAVHEGDDLSARQNMLLGAMLAGQAFANAPVAAVHALAYPLGGHFHIPHGLSNSLVLPEVMKFNLPAAASLYAELAPIIFPHLSFPNSPMEAAQQLIQALEILIQELGLPNQLRQMNISESHLEKLAEDAMLQQRLLANNPREVSYDDALAIYQAVY